MLYTKEQVKGFIGKELGFTKTFNGTPNDNFSAYSEATTWLKEHRFDTGSMERGAPIGIAKNADIAKWRNLDSEDKKQLDGVMVSESFREMPVTIYLIDDPIKEEV